MTSTTLFLVGLVASVSPCLAAEAPPPSAPQAPALDLSKFELTFQDDFDRFTSSPDGNRGWRTTLAWGNRTLASNHELQYYSDVSVGGNPFRLAGGVLFITAAPGANTAGLPYVSGVITTEGRFSQTYGYFEIRAKLPSGKGFWPAFWLLPVSRAWPPELDVFEQYGADPNDIVVTAHTNATGTHTFSYQNVKVADVTTDFHTYGVDWEPAKIKWFVDGVLVNELLTPDDMNTPMYMIANLAVSEPPQAPTLQGTMSIDYIRAYRRKRAD